MLEATTMLPAVAAQALPREEASARLKSSVREPPEVLTGLLTTYVAEPEPVTVVAAAFFAVEETL